MANLIKADLLRIVKDKLFMILLIIGGALAIVMPLFYFGVFSLFVEDGMTVREIYSAKDIALAAFSPFSNFGLVLAIFMTIIITKDFGNGTVRNKLIMGKTRLEVYASNVITSLIVIVGTVLAFAVIQLMVSTIFFNVGITSDNASQFIQSFVYQILGWIVLALAINFYATIMKNAGLAIIVYVITGLVLTFVGSIISSVIPSLEYMGGNETVIAVLNAINAINFVGSMSTTLAGAATLMMGSTTTEFTAAFICEYLGSVAAFGCLFGFLGYGIFKKKDLK